MSDDASFAGDLQRAKAALDLRRPDEALRHLDRALAAAPHDDRLWCLRAQAMLQLERPEEALEAAQRAAGLDPTEEWSHRLASVALVNLDRPADAVIEAREAVRLAPHLPIVRVQLAQAMANLPELRRAAYDEALAAVTLDPTEPECHLVVADTARKLGWTRQAETAYRQVLAMDPGNAAAMNNLAVLRLQQGRTGEALSGFTAAAAHDPRMAVARRNVEVTAWKLVQRVTLALWVTTWVASALTDDRGQSGTDLPLGGLPSSGTLAPIFGAVIIVVAVRAVVEGDPGDGPPVRRAAAAAPAVDAREPGLRRRGQRLPGAGGGPGRAFPARRRRGGRVRGRVASPPSAR